LFVSVVIVTRDRCSSLLRCLQSVIAQDYKDIELIVVDNASTDDTLQMLKANYPNLILLPQSTNTGAPEGRNIGIRQAKGEICICIDDDAELINPNSISKCVEYFTNDKKVGCLSMRVLDEKNRIVTKLIPRRDRKIYNEDMPGALFSATGCAIRRKAFIEAGEFWSDLNPYFGEEPDLSYRLLDLGYTILQTPHVSVRHHKTPDEAKPSQNRRTYYGTRNAPWLALRSLPWYSVIGLTILSWGYFFLIALRDRQLRMYFRAIAASIQHMPAVYRIRKPISKSTQKLLWQYSGLILF